MRSFRFRAAVALEARRRQEDAAAAVFSRADGAFRLAEARVEEVRERRRQALARSVEAQRQGTTAADLEWHRNWISGLAATADGLGRDAARLAEGRRQAERAWQETRRRRLVLERLREKLAQRHHLAESRQENTDIDELARLRHLSQPGGLRKDEK